MPKMEVDAAPEPLFKNPREVAVAILESFQRLTLEEDSLQSIVADASIAGPGFVNVRLNSEYMATKIMAMLRNEEGLAGWAPSIARRTGAAEGAVVRCVVDYSSPNIAKEMHVGHLRSTIIGDTLANMLSFCGADVLRLNHVGDWGTQFGMLIEYMEDTLASQAAEGGGGGRGALPGDMSIGNLQELYKAAKLKYDEDAGFKLRAQERVVKLQQGDEVSRQLWQSICEASRSEFNVIYDRLGIQGLVERGESFYNPLIPDVLHTLIDREIAVVDDGALCVFPFGRDKVPLIVRKSDGGYNYASTDLAALRQRVEDEEAAWILYVTDVGQREHFKNVFETARSAGWLDGKSGGAGVEVFHVGFGLVLGEDGKRFRTRSGDVVRLAELLDEAKRRCRAQLDERDSCIPSGGRDKAAEVLGYGAVKYADLSNNRQSNYVFSFDKMLDMKVRWRVNYGGSPFDGPVGAMMSTSIRAPARVQVPCSRACRPL